MLSINTYVGYKILNKDKNVENEVKYIDLTEYRGESVESVDDKTSNVVTLVVDNSNSNDEYELIAKLYNQIMSSNYPLDDIDRELNNILLVKLANMNVTENDKNVLFHTLSMIVDDGVNVIDYFYPLAKYVHLQNCNQEHMINNFAEVECDSLNKDMSCIKLESFSEYVTRRAYKTGSRSLIEAVDRINNSDYTLEECLKDLDAVYTVCVIPTDLSEELWQSLFSKLLTTTNEFENVCSVYYDLATFIHRINCEYTHDVNVFGAVECEAVTYKLT